METIYEAKEITKRYGSVTALDHFSAGFEQNKIYGLLGRNGAGKTTLLNIMTSRIFADSGSSTLYGQNIVENGPMLQNICYMPEKNLFLKHMKVRDILTVAASFYKDYDHVLEESLCEKFGINKKAKYSNLSRGYESILRLIIGLSSRAPVTIFDEPVLGLDAAVRDLFYRELIEDFTEHPRTIIISTHLIEESADIFDEAIIIKNGRLIEQSSVEQLKEKAHYVSGRADLVDGALSGLNVIHSESVGNVKISAVYEKFDDDKRQELVSSGLDLSPVPVQKLFIYLTNNTQGGEQSWND